jgi:hypothetical protein
MPRPIVLTEEIKKKALADFSSILDGMKMSDGKISYSTSFSYKDANAIVWLTQEAYRKIVALVMGFSDEVGWHGTVSRVGDINCAGENEFIIEDIFVYPQEVTGSTVNTDQTAYTQWLYALDNATFNKIRMQGQSHVNMGVTPSGVDDKHRQQILDQLEKDMFYVFMIWNKSLSVHTLIYDMQRNVLYEDRDVTVKLVGDEAMDTFLADAKEKVQKPKPRVIKKLPGKTKLGSKKQKTRQLALDAEFEGLDELGQLRHLGFDVDGVEDADELEELRRLGLNVDPETLSYYSRYGLYDPYDLGGRAWRR